MSSTLADLRTQCRALLASTDDWPDATLDAFIQDAIRFYSADFPRRLTHTLSLATGTQNYSLPAGHGFRKLLAVEYPTGEDPPSFLGESHEWARNFAAKADVYAIRGPADTVSSEEDSYHGEIVFAETVTTGESARLHYHGTHRIPDAGDDDAEITVPLAHWEALVAFVDFRCHAELEADEAVTVSTISIVLAQLGQEARVAWNRYKDVIDHLHAMSAVSATIEWDLPDRWALDGWA